MYLTVEWNVLFMLVTYTSLSYTQNRTSNGKFHFIIFMFSINTLYDFAVRSCSRKHPVLEIIVFFKIFN